ncbi:hypothetical protein [Streptomyces sp. NWU49]|uniref:hypothetical protein n=1 Tax=Streptomyces sp. NWU49 TaxID=2201153 RepID=UPI0015E7ED26|nr:hypothetical protein [Streptomyces sp. NWU49]
MCNKDSGGWEWPTDGSWSCGCREATVGSAGRTRLEKTACGAGKDFFRGVVGKQAAQLRLETLMPFALLSRKAGSDPLAQDLPGVRTAGGRLLSDLRVGAAAEDDVEQDATVAVGVVSAEHVDRQD